MRVAFVIFARNKAPYVASAVRSALSQTYTPVDLVFSDHGSTDGTLDIIKREAATYNGPNKIKIVECPRTEQTGMHGLLAHLNWLHSVLDYEFLFIQGGDDLSYPDKVARSMKVMERLERKPLYLATGQHYVDNEENLAKGISVGHTLYHGETDWIDPVTQLDWMVGGSCATNYAPELLEIMGGGFPPHTLVDVYAPFIAALHGGLYYLKDIVGAYVNRPDPANTGLEGRMRMAKGDVEKAQIQETAGYQLTRNALAMAIAAKEWAEPRPGPGTEIVVNRTLSELLDKANNWALWRAMLVELNAPPQPLPGKF